MTIQQYRYVLEIARTGSFSEASKQLFVAQSSLSVSIKSLETELGIKIFDRSASGVYLTEDGAEFARYARKIVDSDDFISERYKNKRAPRKLHIATQHYDFIADIFGSFLNDIGDSIYNFSIKEIETYNVIGEVMNGTSDIGIIAIKDGDFDVMKRYLDKRGVSFNLLLEAAPHVFVRRTHPIAARESVEYRDLSRYPYVSYEQGEHNSAYFTEEMLDSAGVEKHIEISDRATLMNLLLLTDAYTVGTGIMPSALNKGDIVSVPLASSSYYLIGYILNNSRRVSELAEEFILSLKTSIEKII